MAFGAWRQLTWYLVFSCVVYLQGALLFGIDTGSFGSLQALPSFLSRFGVQDGSGPYSLPAARKSLMNSLPWIGKLVGCFSAEALIESRGYRNTMYLAASVQIVAVILELTAHHWAHFTVGRILAYGAVGWVENAVPAFNAEVSPAAIRGLLSGSLMMVTGLGNLWGAGMSQAYAAETGIQGWIIPTSMQLIPAVGLLILLPFTPESPRWLLAKGHKPEAQKALDRIRPARDVRSGVTRAEIETLEGLISEAQLGDNGRWVDLFRGNYLRRTWICTTLFVLEQTNGNQFVQSYGATFYVQQGLGSMAFTYATIGQVVSVIGGAIGIVLFDISGRRPLMIGGSMMCALLLYVAAGLGTRANLTESAKNMILTSFILLPAFTRMSASNNAFLTGAEIGGMHMRKKTLAFGTACDVLAAFLVTFVTPYLLPHMGVNIGWIFGCVAAFAVVWSFLFFPELTGRSLEEVDELFEARLPAWRFKKYETHGAARRLAIIENDGVDCDGLPAAKEAENLHR